MAALDAPSAPLSPEEQMVGDVSSSLGCMVCGARGCAPCSLAAHAASIVGFAAWSTREQRIAAVRRAEEQP